MADDVKLTKYIDGAGIKALYKSIREKVTGKTNAVTGTWTAAQATKAAQVSSSTTTDPYWLLGTTTQTNSDGTSLVKRADIKVTYESSGRACLNAPTFRGKFIGSVDGTATNATYIKSTLATGEYYILGSTNSAESTDTPVKTSTIKADKDGHLTANGFKGPIYINAASNGIPTEANVSYLLTSTGTTAGYSSPIKTTNLYYNHSLDVVNQDPVHGLHADQFIGKFVGDLEGNAKTATNADKADQLKVTTPANDNLGAGSKFYFWGDTSSSSGYSSVLKRSNTYLSTGTIHGDQLYVGGVTVPARTLASECGDNELTPKAYVDWAISEAVTSGVSSVMTIKGRYGAMTTTNDLPTKADDLKKVKTGWTYIVSADGLTFAQQNYSGENAQQVDKGDMIVCVGEDATNGTNVVWTIIQRNIPEALTAKDITDLLDIADGEAK